MMNGVYTYTRFNLDIARVVEERLDYNSVYPEFKKDVCKNGFSLLSSVSHFNNLPLIVMMGAGENRLYSQYLKDTFLRFAEKHSIPCHANQDFFSYCDDSDKPNSGEVFYMFHINGQKLSDKDFRDIDYAAFYPEFKKELDEWGFCVIESLAKISGLPLEIIAGVDKNSWQHGEVKHNFLKVAKKHFIPCSVGHEFFRECN